MSVFGAQTLAASTSQQGSANRDAHVEMVDPPTDSVSSISFSPQADFLAVGSWDNSVCIYSYRSSLQIVFIVQIDSYLWNR
jgi:mRNA export factor